MFSQVSVILFGGEGVCLIPGPFWGGVRRYVQKGWYVQGVGIPEDGGWYTRG